MADRPDLPRPPLVIYANWVTPTAGHFELALDFGQKFIREDEPTNEVRVFMSWEEAVILRDILNNQIAGFEEHVGQIRVVKGPEYPVGLDDDEQDEDGDDEA